jgi:hypothetical protein
MVHPHNQLRSDLALKIDFEPISAGLDFHRQVSISSESVKVGHRRGMSFHLRQQGMGDGKQKQRWFVGTLAGL